MNWSVFFEVWMWAGILVLSMGAIAGLIALLRIVEDKWGETVSQVLFYLMLVLALATVLGVIA